MEPEVFKEDAIPIIQALDSTKTPYTLAKFGVSYDDYIRHMYVRPIAERDVIFYGSFQFAEVIKKTAPKIKIYGDNLNKYNCTYYYPAFGGNLLNKDYIMLPLGDLERRILSLNHILGINDMIFVRPDAINKAFTGITINVNDKLKFPANLSKDMLLLVAEPKQLTKEWRFVVVKSEVVTGGQYKENSKIVRISDVPDSVYEYAQKIVMETAYRPDNVWTLDICQDKIGELSVLEVGPFSCSGLYACDATKIVKAIKKLYE
jgi:hypothetical protein